MSRQSGKEGHGRGISRRGFVVGGAAGIAAATTTGLRAAPGLPAPDHEAIELPSPISIDDVDTPALLVDLDALEDNLRKMARHIEAKQIALRPHIKTHKCAILAAKQIELGAIGVCAAKVSEAEVMVDAGIENVLITSPVVTPEKIRRVIALARKTSGLQIVVDHAQNVRDFGAAATAAKIELRVLIDLDTGTRRTGIATGKPALELAQEIGRTESLRLDGLQAYAGHVMHVAGHGNRKQSSLASLEPCLETRDLLQRAGFEIGVFTGGGTGTYDIDCDVDGMTDLQLGSYLFMDVQYRAIGDSDSDVFDSFRPSLFVLATAISQPVPELITIDAGYKAFANEPAAKPQFRDLDGLIYHYGGDEHGIVQFTSEDRPLRLGQKAELIVSHCDPTVNLYDVYHPYRNGEVRELWPISARGRSQ
jgi:3-hydroxy-D-aspartate aldolase